MSTYFVKWDSFVEGRVYCIGKERGNMKSCAVSSRMDFNTLSRSFNLERWKKKKSNSVLVDSTKWIWLLWLFYLQTMGWIVSEFRWFGKMLHVPSTIEEQLILKAFEEECPWENLPKRVQATLNLKDEWHRRWVLIISELLVF